MLFVSPGVACAWIVSAPFAGLIALHYWRRAGRTLSLLYHEVRLIFGRIELQQLRSQLDQLRQQLRELSEQYAIVAPRKS